MPLELVSLTLRPALTGELYDLIDRNRGPASGSTTDTSVFYPDISAYRRDVEASNDVKPLPSTGLQTDFYALLDEDVVVAGLEVVLGDESDEEGKGDTYSTISCRVDIANGKGHQGYATNGVRLLSEELSVEGEFDFLDSFPHKKDQYFRNALKRNGYSPDPAVNALRNGDFLRYIRAVGSA